jgi:SH3 domain-containing protein
LPPQQSDEPSQNSERNADQVATSENKATSSESGDKEPKPVELAKVVLAAQTHSQASVSSPTVRFYRPGTELQVVRREGIWFEVSDPVTQERGWVLAQYLSSIESPTPTQVATESTTEPLTVKPTSPKSNKRHRSAAKIRALDRVATADQWNRRADRRRGFGLFIFRPLPRLTQR